MPDKIILSGVPLSCRLGVSAEERSRAQPVVVDLEMRLDLSTPGRSDRFADTVDYAAVRQTLVETAARREYVLLESLAETMAQEVLARFPVPELCLRVAKPFALQAFGVQNTAIEIVRRAG